MQSVGVRYETEKDESGAAHKRPVFVALLALLVAAPLLYPHDVLGYGSGWVSLVALGCLAVYAGLLLVRKKAPASLGSTMFFAVLCLVVVALVSALPGGVTRTEITAMSLNALPILAIAFLALAFSSGYVFGSAGTHVGSVFRTVVSVVATISVVYMLALLAHSDSIRFIWEGRGAHAPFFGLAAILAYALFRGESRPSSRLIVIGAFVVLVCATVLSRDVAYLFVIGLGIFAVEGLVVLREYRFSESGLYRYRKWSLLAFVAGASLATVAFLGLPTHIPDQFSLENVGIRPSFQVTHTMLLREYDEVPLTMFIGSGPASFSNLWWLYRPDEINRTALWATGISTPYSFVTHVIALFGIPVGLAFILVLVFSVAQFVHGALRAERRGRAYTAIGGSVVGGYFLVSSMFSPLEFSFLVLTVFILGFFRGAYKVSCGVLIRKSSRADLAAGILFVGIGVASIVVGSVYMRAYREYASSLEGLRSESVDYIQVEQSLARSLSYVSDAEVAIVLAQVYEAHAQKLLLDLGVDKLTSEELAEVVGIARKGRDVAIQGLALDPLNMEAHLALGNAELLYSLLTHDKELYQRALWRYQSARKLAPNSPLPLFLLGRAYSAGGDLGQARDVLRRALKLKPDYVAAQRLLDQIGHEAK